MNILIVTPVMRQLSGVGQLFPRALASQYALEWTRGYLDYFNVCGGDNYKDGNKTVTDGVS